MVVTTSYAYLTGAISNNTVVPETDAITMKLAASTGSVVWSTTYGGAAGGYDMGKHIALDGAGDVYITGGSYNTSYNSDFLTIRYNGTTGSQTWLSTYDYSFGADDAAIKIAVSGSNVTVSGGVTSGANTYKYATLTYAKSTGSLTATNIGTTTTTSSITVVTDLTADGAGNSYFVGSVSVAGHGEDFYVIKTSNTLVTAWTYTFNGAGNLDDVPKAVQVDASGNVYVSGYTTSSTQGKNIALIKLNSSGVQQWVKYINDTINGDDDAADVVIDDSDNIYITGYRTNTLNYTDYYTAKFNGSGTKLWEIETDGDRTLNDKATNMCLDTLNNVIITGQSETSPGVYNFITVKYVQSDVITPTDFNGETPSPNFMYYANRGQIVDTTYTTVTDVKYYTNNTYPAFYFKNTSQSFVFARIDTVATTQDTLHRIDLVFPGCNESSKIYPLDNQKEGYLNYFLGYLGSNGVTGVFGNQRLITQNLYNNIDLMCSSNQHGIKYYFIIKPGGNIRDIQMQFNGASSFTLNGTSNALSINSSVGHLTFDRPTAYQLTTGNATVAVTGWTPDWATNGAANKYKFNDGAYTSSLTLVIEVDQGNTSVPTVTTTPNIEWSTNFGSSGFDSGRGIKHGSGNNLFLAGRSSTSQLPQVPGISVFQSLNKGLSDGYIAKFDQTGVLKWTTYVGGSGQDQLSDFDIAANGTGDLYCIGTTQSTTLSIKGKPGTSVNYSTHSSAGSNNDGFIFQLQQDGLHYNWLTYYGGTGDDYLTGCQFDADGNLFIIGYSTSSSLTVVGTAPQYTCGYIDTHSRSDGYVMKLNHSTFNIDWATYIASSTTLATTTCSTDELFAMDINQKKELIVGGYSTGTNYPVLHSAGSSTAAATTNCLGDGVVTKFDNSGQMLWSTYIHSNGTDAIQAIKADGADLYVGGYTNSTTTFPTLFSGSLYANTTKTLSPTGPYQESGFLLWFDYLNHRQHATLIGGDDGDDQITAIAIDAVHNIYLVGSTTSTSLELPSGGNPVNTWSEINKGLHDEFIFAIKNGTTDVIWSTEVGGNNQEGIDVGVSIDGNNKLFLSSTMQSALYFPWNDGGGYPVHFQGSLTGGVTDYDGCITRFKLSDVNFVGVKEHTAITEGILVYPNPTHSNLTIRLQDVNQPKKFTIFNTMGQHISSGTLQPGSNTINVSTLAEGMYIMEISDRTTKVTTKFIKQ